MLPAGRKAPRLALPVRLLRQAAISVFLLQRRLVFDSNPPGRFQGLAEQEAQEILGFVDELCREAGVKCTKLVVASEVIYRALIEAAKQNDCDLIFMASYGRRGLSALLAFIKR